MVAQTIFAEICVVGMARAESVAQVVVIVGMLVFVAHEKPDGAACGASFKNARQQFDAVSFFSRSGEFALSRPASVEFLLYKIKVNLNASRHAVNDTSDAWAVAFSKGCQSE